MKKILITGAIVGAIAGVAYLYNKHYTDKVKSDADVNGSKESVDSTPENFQEISAPASVDICPGTDSDTAIANNN